MLAINSLARRTISSPLTREVAQQIKETTSSTIALRSIDQRGFLELQKRSYSTQKEGNAGRDKIYTGPFGTTVTGTQIVFGGGGVLFLLLAAFFGWVYCETQSEGELCESIRTKIGINKKINNIPEPASHCIERKQALERIEMLFSYSKRDPSVVAIVGDPASGKTELCKQYGRKHKNDYHHIWFVQIESWQKEYQNLARDWKLFSEKEIEEKEGMDNIDINSIIARVHNSFSREGRKKSLIIFENAPEGFIVDKLNGQLPKQTDILITSRSTHWESTLNLSTECRLTVKEGMDILRKWTENERLDPIEAEKIVRRFAYSPVPIAQAGRYLFKTKEPINKYLPLFERNKQEILKQGTLSGNIDVVVSLKIAIAEIKKVEPEAVKLLYCCTLLPAKNIPKDLLVKLFNLDRGKLNHCLLLLDSLLLRDAESVSLHDLFQEIIEEETNKWGKYLLLEVCKASDGFEDFLMTNPKKAMPILKQRLEGDQTVIANKKKRGKIQYLLGSCYSELGDMQESLRYFESSLSLGATGGMSQDESSMARRYGIIGVELRKKELYDEALKFDQKSLEIRKKVSGEEHSETGSCYSNVGATLSHLGLHKEALKHHQKSLEIRKKVLGEEHADTTISYSWIGVDLGNLRRHEEALKHHQKSLEIRKKVSGEEHPETGTCYNNVGASLSSLGRHEEALKHHQKSLEIRKKVLGEEHLETGKCYNNVGASLSSLGRHEEALKHHKKSLEIRMKVLGEEDLATALSYNSISISLSNLGQNKEALEYSQKAFRISCKIKHPHQDIYLKNLIFYLNRQSDGVYCQKVKQEMLPLCLEKFGKDDSLTKALQESCLKITPKK